MMPLLILLALAWALVALNTRFGTKATRRMADRAANSGAEALDCATVVARVGMAAGVAPQPDGTLVLRASAGLRDVTVLLCGGLVAFVCLNPQFLIAGNAIASIAVVAAFAGWHGTYIWTYAVRLTDDTITLPTYAMGTRTWPLADLRDVEDDGAYGLRLIFAGGAKPLMLKHVVQGAQLAAALGRAVKSGGMDAGTAGGGDRPRGPFARP